MGDHTKIEWTDATWNPVTGCALASEGCRHCYAARLAATRMKNHPSRAGLARMNAAGEAKFTGEVRFNDEWLDQPLRWRKPRMVFAVAHGDLFYEKVPDEWIDRVFAVMSACPQHTFQVLTRRPERAREYLTTPLREYAIIRAIQELPASMPFPTPGRWPHLPLPNVWLGTSVEDQASAEARIPDLLETPAAIRWLSAEPLLAGLDLENIRLENGDVLNALTGEIHDPRTGCIVREIAALDWIVVGGESGANARPMQPDWPRQLRDQCARANVPFFFKQWGGWLPGQNDAYPNWDGRSVAHHQDGSWGPKESPSPVSRNYVMWEADGTAHFGERTRWFEVHRWATRVGKKRAGRLLDGVEHSAFPKS